MPQIANAFENMEKGKRLLTVGASVGAATVENGVELPQKTKDTVTICPAITVLAYIQRKQKD